MKKLNSVVLVLVGSSVALLLQPGGILTVTAECGIDCPDGPCNDPPCCNGDVNGDGGIDLADAVYILQHLFAQGPDIEPIHCDSTCVDCKLPATGQSLCYDASGTVLEDCDNADFPGQDGFHRAGCPLEDRFEVIEGADVVIIDRCTGLMWQQATADMNGDEQIDDADTVTWQAALQYCEDLKSAGHLDWRLPNLRELLSLLDYGRFPVFDAGVFNLAFVEPGGTAAYHWSSTTGVEQPELARVVTFRGGGCPGYRKVGRNFVLAVRDAAPAR